MQQAPKHINPCMDQNEIEGFAIKWVSAQRLEYSSSLLTNFPLI